MIKKICVLVKDIRKKIKNKTYIYEGYKFSSKFIILCGESFKIDFKKINQHFHAMR